MSKPSFKKVGGPRTYVRYADCKKGDVLVEGTYIGTVPNQYNKDKPNYEFAQSNGEANLVLNSAGKLNYLMDNFVTEGDVVQISYLGKSKVEKGPMKGKDAHDFEVLVAESNNTPAPKADNENSSLDLSDLD